MILTTEQKAGVIAAAQRFKDHTHFYIVAMYRALDLTEEQIRPFYVPLLNAFETLKNNLNTDEYVEAVQAALASL